jgi:hypothetical protein
MKMFVEALHIQYANIEATLPTWRVKTLLKIVVFGDLVLHQMLYFSHNFGIIDTTAWYGITNYLQLCERHYGQ